MPFGSAFSVHNLGVELEKLPLIYLLTGISSIFMGPFIGRASDAFGKYKMFLFGSILSIAMVLIYTQMGLSPLWLVIIVNIVLFVGIFSRMIPAQALMSAIPSPANRGSFMSVSSSIQQISGGIASILAGLIVIEATDGRIGNFDILGYVVVGAILVTLLMMTLIHRKLGREPVDRFKS